MTTNETPDEILSHEFSAEFVELMRNRMIVSFFKYGKVATAYPSRVDAVSSLKQRLDRYAETGNTEWMVDVANFAMIEFMLPRHPDAHFKGTDSHESPGRIIGGEATDRANPKVETSDERMRRMMARNGD